MKRMLFAVFAFMVTTPALAQDNAATCKFAGPVQEVSSTKQLPPGVISSFGKLADRGEVYHAGSGTLINSPLANSRFVRGGTLNGVWFVVTEGGGWGFKSIAVYKDGPNAPPLRKTILENVCASADSLLAEAASIANAKPAARPACTLRHKVEFIPSLAQLPTAMLNELGNLGPTFVAAGHMGRQWFVWIGYEKNVTRIAMFDEIEQMPRFIAHGTTNVPGDPCTRTDALLDDWSMLAADKSCKLTRPATTVFTVREVPASILAHRDMSYRGPIQDPDTRSNGSANLLAGGNMMRLIRADRIGELWAVWIEVAGERNYYKWVSLWVPDPMDATKFSKSTVGFSIYHTGLCGHLDAMLDRVLSPTGPP